MHHHTKLIKSLYKAFDDRDLDKMLSFFTPRTEMKIVGMDEPLRGPENIREFMEDWIRAFPDVKNEIGTVLEGEDFVVLETIAKGTHEGPLESEEGKVLQPTHRKIAVPSCDIFKISGDKIQSWTCYWQDSIMEEQLGLEEKGAKAA